MKLFIKIAFMIVVFVFVNDIYSQVNVLDKKPYFFDVGTINSDLLTLSNQLTESDLFSEQKGFGWAGQYESFVNEEYRRRIIRDELTHDGIEASELTFKINLPEGKWYFTFWIEAGYEDIAKTTLFINGEKHKLTWHQLKVGAEGRNSPIENYRVIHTKVTAAKEGLTFTLKNENQKVQLLAFSFCPPPIVKNDIHKTLDKIVQLAGHYRSKVILDELSMSLKNNFRENPNDPFFFYWWQQVALLAEAERYLNTQGWEWARQMMEHSIFDRMHQALLLFDTQIENFDTSAYPLKERAMWKRGKLCYNLELERGGNYQLEIAKKDLNKLYKWHPDDKDLAMLNGEKVDLREYCDNLIVHDDAPMWSTLQREAFCRLKSIIKWWVEEKQAPNGELGGKIGDDVEILRWWSTFLLMGDETTIEGWTKLAETVWNDPKVHKGFSRHILDVEHSSEFISDSTPELILIDNSKAREILKYTVKYFRDLWTYKNEEGRRYFKSAWYSSTEIDERPPRNRDLGYNTRTVKPLRYLAWETRNPEYIKLLHEWAKGWLYAAMKTEGGKPKGIVPAAIRYYDESITADNSTWYEPDMYWDYFGWSHDAGSKILDQLLFTYTLTKDDDLLQPVVLSLELIKKYENLINTKRNFEKGSEIWAAYHLANEKSFWSVVQSWRIISGNDKYDDLIKKFGTPYVKFRLTGDKDYLIDGLEYLLENARYNVPLRTYLVLHTDRVYIRGNQILKAMITGSGSSGDSPYYKVTWENASNDLTMLVTESTSSTLQIDLFSYLDEEQTVTARPWGLEKGNYELKIEGANYKEEREVTIEEFGQKISIDIPSKKLVTVKFIRK